MEKAFDRLERGLDLAEAFHRPDLLVRGWNTKAMLVAARRPEEARALFQLAYDRAIEQGAHTLATSSLANLSDLALRYDRYAESLAHLEQTLALSRRIGHRSNEWFALSEMTYALTMLGRWDEALTRLAEIPGEQIGADPSLLSPLSGVLQIHLRRGELGRAQDFLARFEAFSRLADIQTLACWNEAVAGVRFAEGNHPKALAAAEEAVARWTTVGLAAQGSKLGTLQALDAAFALGDHRKVEELIALVEQQPPGLRPPLLVAASHRFRARLAGDDPGADRQFSEAASILRELELSFHLAVVLLEHGEWLLRQARGTDADPFLAEARETFEQLAAAPWLERAQDALPAGRESEPVPAG